MYGDTVHKKKSKMPRVSPSDFNDEELQKMVDAIIERNAYRRIKQRSLYQELAADFVLNGRSASAMLLAMQQQISHCFEKFCSLSEAKRFRESYYRDNRSDSSVGSKSGKNRIEAFLSDSDSSSTDLERNMKHAKRKVRGSPRESVKKTRSPLLKRSAVAKIVEESDEDVEILEKAPAAQSQHNLAKQKISWSPSTNFETGTALGRSKRSKMSEKNAPSFSEITSFSCGAEMRGKGKPTLVGNDLLSEDDNELPSFSAVTNFSCGAEMRGKGKPTAVGNDLLFDDDSQRHSSSSNNVNDDGPSFSDVTMYSIGAAMRGKEKLDQYGVELAASVDDHPDLINRSKDSSNGSKPEKQRIDPTKVPVVLLTDFRKAKEGISALQNKYTLSLGTSHEPRDAASNTKQKDAESRVAPPKDDEPLPSHPRATASPKSSIAQNLRPKRKVDEVSDTSISVEKELFMVGLKLNYNVERDDRLTEDEFEASQSEQNNIDQVAAAEKRPASGTNSAPKGKLKPSNPMVAVGVDIRGKKCFFKLIPMSSEEVDAIEAPCLPYVIQPPSLTGPMLPGEVNLNQ